MSTMRKRVVMLAGLVLGLVACRETEYVHVGPNWAALDKLDSAKTSFAVEAQAGNSYPIGSSLHFSVSSDAGGRLWIVQIDAADRVDLLYPNEMTADNAIKARTTVQIPPAGAEWSLEAGEPVGKSLVVFIVTTGDLDLDAALRERKDAQQFVRTVETGPAWGFAKRVVSIEEARK
jgi:hypothetical protein